MSIFKNDFPLEAFEAFARRVRSLSGQLYSFANEYPNGCCENEILNAAAGYLLTLEDVYRNEAKMRAEGRALGVFEEKFKDMTPTQLNSVGDSLKRDLENPRTPGAKTRIISAATFLSCLFKNAAKRAEEKEARGVKASKN